MAGQFDRALAGVLAGTLGGALLGLRLPATLPPPAPGKNIRLVPVPYYRVLSELVPLGNLGMSEGRARVI